MENLSEYMVRKIGKQLRNKEAEVGGKTCTGNAWPEGEHYWIINSYVDHATYHVAVDRRPSWDKYYPV